MRGIGRTSPAEKAKERVIGEKASMEAKEEREAKEHSRSRNLAMDEDQEADEEDERGRVAPNMGAGGSHPQATSDPRKERRGEERDTSAELGRLQ